MCNDYEQHVLYEQYAKLMQQLELGIPVDQGELDLPMADDIRIGQIGPVMRAAGNLVELALMKFGKAQPGRGPLFNFRSENRHFANSQRCLIPASAFFEFTGTKYPKAKHRFTLNDAPFMAIAGLWWNGEGNEADSFAMLTTSPGPDIAPYHDRQIVVLKPADWGAWLSLSKPEAELLRPLPAASLHHELVRPGS